MTIMHTDCFFKFSDEQLLIFTLRIFTELPKLKMDLLGIYRLFASVNGGSTNVGLPGFHVRGVYDRNKLFQGKVLKAGRSTGPGQERTV